jgi:mRNA-degrading endonuclease RelE of RelBE toxin-antitoxin system
MIWRLRVGDYRVIYRIDDNRRIVDISHVRHRRDAYQ